MTPDPNKPQTPCEKRGIKPGDRFMTVLPSARDPHEWPAGTVVRLVEDDGSSVPLFEVDLDASPCPEVNPYVGRAVTRGCYALRNLVPLLNGDDL